MALDALKDCNVIISGGMGWRFAEDLKARNIHPIITTEELADKAVEFYIKGELKTEKGQFCQH
ncbi:MAG: NifB/NifX family molybdenum-iron cluster-binding protein [Planctomycetota bacterium]|nr:NifB/NifX family molybdenum-iron cluster-binding protein [Planctomycetota bacterium]